MKYASRLILFSFSLLLCACATTKVEESWTLPGYTPVPNQKVLVVTLASSEAIREAFESTFVKQLGEKGISAFPSKRWLPDSTKVNKESLRPILAQNGITTVLVSSLRGVEKDQTYQPAENLGPPDNLFRNFDTYQVYSSSGQHEPGTYVEITDYLMESNLFSTKNEKLSWSVSTRSTLSKDIKNEVEDVVSAVLKQAAKDKVL